MIVLLSLFVNDGRAKVELAVAHGKRGFGGR